MKTLIRSQFGHYYQFSILQLILFKFASFYIKSSLIIVYIVNHFDNLSLNYFITAPVLSKSTKKCIFLVYNFNN